MSEQKKTLYERLGHAATTLAKFKVPESEQRDEVTFAQSLKKDIVE